MSPYFAGLQDKRLKTGRGPNTFDTSTRAKLLIIVQRLLAIAVLMLDRKGTKYF